MRVPRKRIVTSLKGAKAVPQWMLHKVVGTLMQARVEYEKELREASEFALAESIRAHGRSSTAASATESELRALDERHAKTERQLEQTEAALVEEKEARAAVAVALTAAAARAQAGSQTRGAEAESSSRREAVLKTAAPARGQARFL